MSAVKRVKVRDPMEYDTHLYDPGIDCSHDPVTGEVTPSLTKQEFLAESDINNIMRRYETTGSVDWINRRQPQFGDFSTSVDFQMALNTVLEAEALFDSLPASVRDRFGNDPSKLLEFLEDPNNRDEAVKLGIVKAPEPEAPPVKVEVTNPPQQDPPSGGSGGPGGAPA